MPSSADIPFRRARGHVVIVESRNTIFKMLSVSRERGFHLLPWFPPQVPPVLRRPFHLCYTSHMQLHNRKPTPLRTAAALCYNVRVNGLLPRDTGMRRKTFAYGRERSLPLVFETGNE